MSATIKTLDDAKLFLESYREFSLQDWWEGEFWFRFDGPTDEFKSHEYTINHNERGIIGVLTDEAAKYVYQNRKRLNAALLDASAPMNFTRR